MSETFESIRDVITALELVKARMKQSDARDQVRDLIINLRREYKVKAEKDFYKLHEYV